MVPPRSLEICAAVGKRRIVGVSADPATCRTSPVYSQLDLSVVRAWKLAGLRIAGLFS